MKRCQFITLLGGAAATWPFTARAQQPATPVVGFLCSGSPIIDASRIASVRKGLRQAGYIEGRNLTIEYRWAEEQYDRLKALATDLAHRPVSVIVAIGTTPAAVAAKAATTTVPTVFVIGADPIKLGLVASLNRPGGNLTGISFLNRVIVAKQFEMLHEVAPTVEVSGFLVNPSNPFTDIEIGDAQAAARTLGRKLLVVQAATQNEIDAAFTTLVQQRVSSLLVAADLFLNNHREQTTRVARPPCGARVLLWAGATRSGWADELRGRHLRCIRPRRRLCGQNSQRREAGRVAGRTGHEGRAGNQSKNRQDAG